MTTSIALTIRRYVSFDMAFKIVSLCASVFAVVLGVISLVGGLHRVPLSMTCFSAGFMCGFAFDIWHREWLKYAAWPFWIGAVVAFFLGIK